MPERIFAVYAVTASWYGLVLKSVHMTYADALSHADRWEGIASVVEVREVHLSNHARSLRQRVKREIRREEWVTVAEAEPTQEGYPVSPPVPPTT